MSKMKLSEETKRKVSQAMVEDMFVIEPDAMHVYLCEMKEMRICIAWSEMIVDGVEEGEVSGGWRVLCSWEDREKEIVEQIDQWIEHADDVSIKANVESTMLSLAVEEVAAGLFDIAADQSIFFRSDAAAMRAIRAGMSLAKEKAMKMLLESSAWDTISAAGN